MSRRNKYNAHMFHGRSDLERERAWQLKMLERAGEIHNLSEQVEFVLIPAQYENGKCIERSCKYRADFTYWIGDKFIVEDVKGYKTDDYIIKRKLMLYLKGIRITEVTDRDIRRRR